VVIAGPAGNNLGAGMTGGLAYVLRDELPHIRCNPQSVQFVPLQSPEELWLACCCAGTCASPDSPRILRLLGKRGRLAASSAWSRCSRLLDWRKPDTAPRTAASADAAVARTRLAMLTSSGPAVI